MRYKRRIQSAGLSNTEVLWLAERIIDAEKESHKTAAFVTYEMWNGEK